MTMPSHSVSGRFVSYCNYKFHVVASLANAHMTYFFASAQIHGKHLQAALNSFDRATRCTRGTHTPEMYYNYAEVLRYAQQYAHALRSLDECLRLEPPFTLAEQRLQQLHAYLTRIDECVTRRGKLRSKRLEEARQSLQRVHKDDEHTAWGDALKADNVVRRRATLSALADGPNVGVCTVLHVVAMVMNEFTVPL